LTTPDPEGHLPTHVAVIMDGNGRWAKRQGKSRSEGHRAGALALDGLMDTALELNIPYISVYAFSTENWNRPLEEIRALFGLLEEYIDSRLESIAERGIRILHSGSMKGLPMTARRRIKKAIQATAHGKALSLNFCLNYGSRQEILAASRSVLVDRIKKLQERGVDLGSRRGIRKLVAAIDEEEMASHLQQNIPDPDLLIRTAGEMRISNFLLWQIAYSEFWFTDKLWPDFDKSDLQAALDSYQARHRKYGGL
jgi:undecaprenyl diphosphate synthase